MYSFYLNKINYLLLFTKTLAMLLIAAAVGKLLPHEAFDSELL
jgi:hypothetical protein